MGKGSGRGNGNFLDAQGYPRRGPLLKVGGAFTRIHLCWVSASARRRGLGRQGVLMRYILRQYSRDRGPESYVQGSRLHHEA